MDDPLGAACSKRPGSAMGRPAVLILGAFMTQTGSSGDLWHLNRNIETGLFMATFGYATDWFVMKVRG
jgi:hypothetical protein